MSSEILAPKELKPSQKTEVNGAAPNKEVSLKNVLTTKAQSILRTDIV